MALINCPECKNKVSEGATACPKCGFPISAQVVEDVRKKAREDTKRTYIGCAGLLAIALFATTRDGCSTSGSGVTRPSSKPADAKPAHGNERATATPTGVRTERHTALIRSSLQDFQAGMPLLVENALSRRDDAANVEYDWHAGDGVTWIKFLDTDSDGVLDRVSAFLPIPDIAESPEITIKSISIALRLVQLASGEQLDAAEFGGWLSRGNATRTFGSTPVTITSEQTVRRVPAILMTIGQV